jgi:hypothetical protein
VIGIWLQDLAGGIAARVPELQAWRPVATWFMERSRTLGLATFDLRAGTAAIWVNLCQFDVRAGEAPTGRTAEALRRVIVHELAHVLQYLRHGRSVTHAHGVEFYHACQVIARAANYPPPQRESCRSWPFAIGDGFWILPTEIPMPRRPRRPVPEVTDAQPTTRVSHRIRRRQPMRARSAPYVAAQALAIAETERRHQRAMRAATTRRANRTAETRTDRRWRLRRIKNANRVQILSTMRRADPVMDPSARLPADRLAELQLIDYPMCALREIDFLTQSHEGRRASALVLQ